MAKFDDMNALLAAAHAQQPQEFDFKHDISVAQRLIDTFATTESVLFDEDKWWQYDAGVWHELGREVIASRLHQWQNDQLMRIRATEDKPQRFYALSPSAFRNVVDHTKVAAARPGFFDTAPRGVMLSGQFLRVVERQVVVEKAHPSHRARNSINIAYDPDWSLPSDSLLSHYLNTTFDDAQTRQRLAEIAGAALLGLGTRFGKAWFLVDGPDIDGQGGTGKSQFLSMLKSTVPDNAWCSISPQDFSDDYKGEKLNGKTLNVVFETPETDIIREDGVKAIIHGDPVTRRRIQSSPVTFTPRALHVFAINRLPEAPGATGAFWDRWEVLEFNRRFRDTDAAIPKIADRIVAEELKHLVHWAIQGARRACAQGRYSTSHRGESALKAWRASADKVAMFVHQWCEPVSQDEEWTDSTTLFKTFIEWCEENGRRGTTKTNFGRRLRAVDGVEKKKSNGQLYSVRVLERHQRTETPWD